MLLVQEKAVGFGSFELRGPIAPVPRIGRARGARQQLALAADPTATYAPFARESLPDHDPRQMAARATGIATRLGPSHAKTMAMGRRARYRETLGSTGAQARAMNVTQVLDEEQSIQRRDPAWQHVLSPLLGALS
jgi:hypothetical protein